MYVRTLLKSTTGLGNEQISLAGFFLGEKVLIHVCEFTIIHKILKNILHPVKSGAHVMYHMDVRMYVSLDSNAPTHPHTPTQMTPAHTHTHTHTHTHRERERERDFAQVARIVCIESHCTVCTYRGGLHTRCMIWTVTSPFLPIPPFRTV